MTTVCASLINYHDAAGTLAAVASIREGSPDCSICVVDNSTDTTEARRLEAGLPYGTDLVIATRNLGFGAACNVAFQKCDAPYILLLNPDARLLPSTLRQLHEVLEKYPLLAAVAPATWWDEERRWLLPTLLPETISQWLASAIAGRWPMSLGRQLAQHWLNWQRAVHVGDGPQAVDFLSGAVLLLRRSAIVAAGGLFDERYFMFYEDADLSRRLCRAGFKLALVPEAHAVHFWRNRPAKANLMAESASSYAECHYPYLSSLVRQFGQNPATPFGWLARKDSHRQGYWGVGEICSVPTCDAADLRRLLGDSHLLTISPSPLGFPAAFRPPGYVGWTDDDMLWDKLDPGRYILQTEQEGVRSWIAIERPAT